jgi:hypothetical protein
LPTMSATTAPARRPGALYDAFGVLGRVGTIAFRELV